MAASFSARRLLLNCTNSLKFGRSTDLFVRVPALNASTESHRPSKSDAVQEARPVGHASTEKVEKINKAMKAYLERAQAHNTFMEEEIAEFEIGKRHLASIMGADPDMFTQEDIDKAIEYLLPSGVFDKKARPKLKHPVEILPKRKAAQFGMDGRPFDFLFYTGKPKFFQVLHELSLKLEDLRKFEDAQFAKGVKPDSADQLLLAGSQWVDKSVLEDRFQEKLADVEYKTFVALIDLVAKQPFANREKDYILQFRFELQKQSSALEIPPLKYDEDGRGYQEAEGARKDGRAHVKLYERGTGKISVNGKTLLEYFPRLCDREQIIFPLHLTGKINAVDFTATVEHGGPSGQSGALRLALSRALRSIVDKEMVEKMRLAGLLTRDPRVHERQKPGQAGARKKYTWKKR